MAETVKGTFEPHQGNGGGFLRTAESHYRVGSNDVSVPPELVTSLRLRGGELLEGTVGAKSGKRRSGGRRLSEVTSINAQSIDDHLETKPFEELTAIDPEQPVRFETKGGPLSMRVVDLMTPIGLGQRGLIAAPPRTGKTVLLQQMAHGIATNHPDVYMMVLLIDERPEEVTDMRRNVHGEVIASSNDQDTASHVRIARLMIQKAKRRVEAGENVFILLDSLTRLGRAFNAFITKRGRIMSGGLDTNALIEPKAVFGAARNIEGGGSLTIIASALIDTGSRMDEVIFNEFKGTGNMEIMLSRNMANKRLWPAIDLSESGTRKEERLLSPKALEASHNIRRNLVPRGPERAMDALMELMQKYSDNDEYVASMAPTPLRRFR